MLEHLPVYTLGRGAKETHLTFLQQKPNADSSDEEPPTSSYSISAVSKKLSRKVRGPGTARLSLDRRMEDQIKNMTKSNIDNDDDGDERSMLRVVEKLTENISPVIAPNGVPVYRVDRGGEGMAIVCACVCKCVYSCIRVYFYAWDHPLT